MKGRSGGHNRLPTAVKELQGTLDKRRVNSKEPRVQFGMPEPPAWLDDDSAKEHFLRIGQAAEQAGVISTVDGEALAMAATALSEYLAACVDVKNNGLLIVESTKDGQERTKLNPAASVRADAWRRYREGLRMFGLDPQSRGSVVAIDGLLPAGTPTGDEPEDATGSATNEFFGPAKH